MDDEKEKKGRVKCARNVVMETDAAHPMDARIFPSSKIWEFQRKWIKLKNDSFLLYPYCQKECGGFREAGSH